MIFGTNKDMGILKGLRPSLANCLARHPCPSNNNSNNNNINNVELLH